MNRIMIRGIIFDCFGVLIGSSYDIFLARCPDDRKQELSDYNYQYDNGHIDHDQYVAGISRCVGVSEGEVRTSMQQFHVRNKALVEQIRELRIHYTLAMLSNVGPGVMDDLFAPEERGELFDTVVLSYQEGFAKPEKEIYLRTAERMKLLPEECVMIDDREAFCEGARGAGMQAIQHSSNERTLSQLHELLN